MLANEGNKSGTEDLSSAFKLISLCLGSTFLVFIFFTHMERSIMLQIYFGYCLEKCDRLPSGLHEDNVEIILIVVAKPVVSEMVFFFPKDMSMF